MIERYAWTGSRDVLDHSYSVENFRDNPRLALLTLEYTSHSRSINYDHYSFHDQIRQKVYQFIANRTEFTSNRELCRCEWSLYDNDRLYCVRSSNTIERFQCHDALVIIRLLKSCTWEKEMERERERAFSELFIKLTDVGVHYSELTQRSLRVHWTSFGIRNVRVKQSLCL